MHPKVQADPYFSSVYSQLGEDGILQAGFFYNTRPHPFNPADSLELPCTPLAYVREQLKGAARPAVLLGTGSFNPVHEGHLEMMRVARTALEAAGYTCVGGFLAPDHDEYISAKLGPEALPIHERIRLLADATKFEPWLNVEPWGGVFAGGSLTFTDLVERLRVYLQVHTGQHIPVFYVCGSDNAHFAKAFTHHGHAVMVCRPGYEAWFEDALREVRALQDHYQGNGYAQSVILEAHNPNDLSSTAVRAAGFAPTPVHRRAVVRVVNPKAEMPFVDLLRPYFPDGLTVVTIDEQRHRHWPALQKRLERPYVSLDPYLTPTAGQGHQLPISRVYDSFGLRFLRFDYRPGTDTFNVLRDIAPGAYDLVDDDAQGGATFAHARQMLGAIPGVNVVDQWTLVEHEAGVEVIDARDFILDAEHGGLVVEAFGELGQIITKRVPYVYPFVCPYYRASIADPMAFSKAVWEANIKYHNHPPEGRNHFGGRLAARAQYHLEQLQHLN